MARTSTLLPLLKRRDIGTQCWCHEVESRWLVPARMMRFAIALFVGSMLMAMGAVAEQSVPCSTTPSGLQSEGE
ncbi:MAG TPA: hypothetical protein VEV41_00450, partial [Terriglobales bacterium]|nr:hypothetical protein [Terriglobales bacterium]